MRRLAIFALLTSTLACSATETTGLSSSGDGGSSSGTGGSSSGTGGSTSSGTGGSTSSGTGGSTSSGTGGSTSSSGTGGGFVCPQGAIVCDGDVAKTCDGNGGFSEQTSCTPGVCVPNIGCATCTPGEGTCNGDVSSVCNNEGTGFDEFNCDPVQGVSCNPNTGKCEGTCAPENLGQSYIGCDYYPTVTENELLSGNPHFAVAVANTTNTTANITITQGGTSITTTTVAANDVAVITLPWVQALYAGYQASEIVVDGAYRLRTDRPVTVYQYNPLEYQASGFTYTNDASLLLPVTAWSGNYRVMARNTWSGYPGLYAVTASEDNTTVTATPSATGAVIRAGGGIAADGTGTVVLNQGDVLQVFSGTAGGGPDGADVTGTLITADKPVQVIGGHTCTDIPYNVTWCDHLEESMPPLETVATEYFVAAPLINASTTKQRQVRVLATAPNTTLTYDPPQGAPTQLTNAGDYIDFNSTADFKIIGSEPILVAEYMVGQAAGGGTGDPAFTMSVAAAQYRDSYLFHAPLSYEANYVNITAPTGTPVTLDGNAVGGWIPLGASGFDLARVQLDAGPASNGNHQIDAPLPFGINVYGYGQYTSYWYPGGLDLTPLGL